MELNTKRRIIAVLAGVFLASLLLVQWMEIVRKREEIGLAPTSISVPSNSRRCVDCHTETNPGIAAQWRSSTHAERGVGCVECHQAAETDADSFIHEGVRIATVVTPGDCASCHPDVAEEFAGSHHAAGGNILASLDNQLAEIVEGSRTPFNPHSPTPGHDVVQVEGLASVRVGCLQCHGSKVALQSSDGGIITVDDLQPDADGTPTNLDAVGRIVKDSNGRPLYDPGTWPNTGIGRLNLDGTRGSCSACHSRHDFSPRRARQPENCGKCHLGPDHPQKEIYEESKHGVAYRDLREQMNLDSDSWVLGKDYSEAPTCATCHMSAHTKNGERITHDPGRRISWTNRPPISLPLDTDINGDVVRETDPDQRRQLVVDTAAQKRERMRQVCSHCHTPDYITSFYKQYDDFVILYNEKFAKPGTLLMNSLYENGLLTRQPFDEKIEWTWFYLWHHEGRRARHGASMMAPDYAHWHGMYEVAERFYTELVPEIREITEEARAHGQAAAARRVEQLLQQILDRPEHAWFESGD